MNNTVKSNVQIKSNVTLKKNGVIPPIDNMPDQYFDVRLFSVLTPVQQKQKEKWLFRAEVIKDGNDNILEDDKCYKGCENCGHINNHCKRLQNLKTRTNG
jgi:hypothetical protein